ncbi:MAG: ADP-ribosylglycohydrolase family protein [Candidatus Methylacidiphilales bacterium]
MESKILGCWLGKNCGGTLGGPLERGFSEAEPFDVWWYPQIQEGGIPNDDLEIQLIWLKALEELGVDLTAEDLAHYWLDHIHYNFDEYGFSMTNLRLGLKPPVAGYYNNYFKDCMGCPIRTEIWACVAPGNPRVAARYAYLDSIVDHAGGESIYGSLFNVTVEAAAFSITDPRKLIEIGLTYLPSTSLTARCVLAAVAAFDAGKDWKTARQDVIAVGGSINSQYSPPNIGFQVVGWLWGNDFGDALCKAVNCGYDTDCTGATLGSFLGIIAGAAALPERWTKPLGDTIATSDPTGVKNMYNGSNPAPRTIPELTTRILKLQAKVAAHFGPAPSPTDIAAMCADEEIQRLVALRPTQVSYEITPKMRLDLDYGTSPAFKADEEKTIVVSVTQTHPENQSSTLTITAPANWTAEPAQIAIPELKPGEIWQGSVTLRSPKRAFVENTQTAFFHLQPKHRPATSSSALALIGCPVWLRSEIYAVDAAAQGKTSAQLIDEVFAPEESAAQINADALMKQEARGGNWSAAYADGNDIAVCLPELNNGSTCGVAYLRGFLYTEEAQPVWLHLSTSVPGKLWLNGVSTFELKRHHLHRPAAWGGSEGSMVGDIPFRAGWNELLIKLATDGTTPTGSFAAHVVMSNKELRCRGITDMIWTRFPWDK